MSERTDGTTGPGPILDAAAFDAVVAELVAGDEALARIVAEHGVPPFWSRPPGFRALVLLILEQQVSLPRPRPPTAGCGPGSAR